MPIRSIRALRLSGTAASRTTSYAEPSPRWRWPATPERLKVLGRQVQHGGGGLLHALTEHRHDRQYPRCVELSRHTLASKKISVLTACCTIHAQPVPTQQRQRKGTQIVRSEERRVGKEGDRTWKTRGYPY